MWNLCPNVQFWILYHFLLITQSWPKVDLGPTPFESQGDKRDYWVRTSQKRGSISESYNIVQNWTHSLQTIIKFIIKMYVYKITCMIQYPCSNHASSPSPLSNIGIHMSLIHSQYTLLDNIDFVEWGKCPNSFVQDCSW